MPLAEPIASAPLSAMGRLARKAGALIPSSWMLSAMDCGSLGAFARFISWGFPIERPIRGQQRALHHAIYAPGTRMLEAALAAGAQVDAPGQAGVTALGQALWQNRLDMAQALLSAGADPNLAEPSGETPLHRALLCCPSAVGPLMRAGADPLALGPLMRMPEGWALPLDIELSFIHMARSPDEARAQAPLIAAEIERRELLSESGAPAPSVKSALRGRL